MRVTLTLARAVNCSFFELCDRSFDDVIWIIKYYQSIDTEAEKAPVSAKLKGKEERVRVNDKTATGGWW